MLSGGVFLNSQWFWKGEPIESTWTFGLLNEADDLPVPVDDGYDEWYHKNQQHHWDNDVYGYGWFEGLHLPEEAETTVRIRIRIGQQ